MLPGGSSLFYRRNSWTWLEIALHFGELFSVSLR
jgi:hypothetical protein